MTIISCNSILETSKSLLLRRKSALHCMFSIFIFFCQALPNFVWVCVKSHRIQQCYTVFFYAIVTSFTGTLINQYISSKQSAIIVYLNKVYLNDEFSNIQKWVAICEYLRIHDED